MDQTSPLNKQGSWYYQPKQCALKRKSLKLILYLPCFIPSKWVAFISFIDPRHTHTRTPKVVPLWFLQYPSWCSNVRGWALPVLGIPNSLNRGRKYTTLGYGKSTPPGKQPWLLISINLKPLKPATVALKKMVRIPMFSRHQHLNTFCGNQRTFHDLHRTAYRIPTSGWTW